jgi:hypothetical protein
MEYIVATGRPFGRYFPGGSAEAVGLGISFGDVLNRVCW